MNRTTGRSPFEIVYGIHPRGMCELSDLAAMEYRSGQVEDFTQTMKEIQEEAKNNIQETTIRLKGKLDEKRQDVHFFVGDYVMWYT